MSGRRRPQVRQVRDQPVKGEDPHTWGSPPYFGVETGALSWY